jgi:NADH:ubiquinone oxidoreductase subunit 4 (subunit M)
VNLAAIVPLVAIVLALGLYPQFVVHRTEKDTKQAIGPTQPEVSVIR